MADSLPAPKPHGAPDVTRFAPSPTGPLHLGHAYAALFAAKAAGPGGRFLVRIEDLDQGRSRLEYEAEIFADLAWLGLSWEEPVMRQSRRGHAYRAACDALQAQSLTYPCFCTRKDIEAEIARAGSAPHGPDGPVYPGICRALDPAERAARIARGEPFALRLDLEKALAVLKGRSGRALWFEERGTGPGGETGRIAADPEPFGDIVLMRKDAPASYHLAVAMDDAAQGITLVTRGEDLFTCTHVHRLLQALLDLPVPAYCHHRLIRDERGKRLAKRDRARELKVFRDEGRTPVDVRRELGLGS